MAKDVCFKFLLIGELWFIGNSEKFGEKRNKKRMLVRWNVSSLGACIVFATHQDGPHCLVHRMVSVGITPQGGLWWGSHLHPAVTQRQQAAGIISMLQRWELMPRKEWPDQGFWQWTSRVALSTSCPTGQHLTNPTVKLRSHHRWEVADLSLLAWSQSLEQKFQTPDPMNMLDHMV
jgi:hypothetical protein